MNFDLRQGWEKAAALLAVGLAMVLIAFPSIAAKVTGAGWLISSNLRAVIWGVVVTAAAWAQGLVFLHRFAGLPGKNESGFNFFLAGGIGFGLLSLEAFLLGLAGFYTRPFLTLLVLVVLAGSAAAMKKLNISFHLPSAPSGSSAQLPLGLTCVALFFNFVFVLVPPVYFDAMSYHLELPSRYLLEGKVFHVSENLYSGYPQLVEILFGVGLALDGVGTAGIISFMGLVLVLGLIWSWGRERYDDETAAWATVLVAFIPPFMTLTSFFHNDWYMTFFTLATVMVLAGRKRSVKLDNGAFILAAVLAGFAAGTKYTGLGFAIGVPVVAGLAMGLGEQGRQESLGAAGSGI